MTEGGELTDLDVALYRTLVEHPGSSISELASLVEVSVDDLDKPVAVLREIGLISASDTERLTAVNPSLAEMSSLGAEELELSARRVAMEARRAAIRRVLPEWANALRDTTPHTAV